MSGFEIRPIESEPFVVPRLDITIWNLQSFFATQRFIIDIAIQVTAPSTGSMSKFRLEVPFLYDRPVIDLTDVEDSDFPSWLSTHRGVSKMKTTMSDKRIRGRAVMPGPLVRRRRVSTQLVVELDTALQNGSTRLVVLRFHATVVSFALWKRSLLGINGLILSTSIASSSPNTELVTPTVSAFNVVLRASLQPQLTFPTDVVPALVDEKDWNPYLGRRPDLRGEGALVVLTSIATDDPDRTIYIDASREFGLLPLGNFVRIFLIALFSVYFVLWLRDKDILGPRSPSAGNVFGRIGDAVSLPRAQVLWINVGGVLAIALLIWLFRTPITATWSFARRQVRKADDWFLKIRSKSA